MAKVVWSVPALEDLKDIVDYVAKDSPAYAERVGMHLVEAPRRLEVFPLSGRVVPEFARTDMRELIYGAYRIMYQIRGDACLIAAVVHASRDIVRHLDPGDWIAL